MKKVLVFLLVAMVAGFAGAQDLAFVGNSAVYCVDNTTWYNASADWAATAFDVTDFGLVSALNLGAEVQTYVNDDASHPTMTVTMGYEVDALGAQGVTLPWLSFADNNDKWQEFTGTDVIAGSGLSSAGSHTVAVWFSADDGVTTLYDNNASANYVADFSTAAVPEPATMSLLGLGALAMVLRRKMRK